MRRWSLLSLVLGAVGLSACSNEATVFPAKQADVRVADWSPIRGKYFMVNDPDTTPVLQFLDIQVYRDDRMAANDAELGARPGLGWADLGLSTPAEPYRGSFHLLAETDDYNLVVYLDPLPIPGLILTEPLSPGEALGVIFWAVTGNDTVKVGDLFPAPQDTLRLKLLHLPADAWETESLPQSVWAAVAPLELRNVYDLGVRGLDPERAVIRIVRDVSGPGGTNPTTLVNEFGVETPLLEILGLDEVSNTDTNDPTPDGKVDDAFIDYANGLLVFPDFRPFDPSLADISGTNFRPRSWPRSFSRTRPDTLGWHLEAGNAVPSSQSRRDVEVVPEIYDRTRPVLETEGPNLSIYAIELFLDGTN